MAIIVVVVDDDVVVVAAAILLEAYETKQKKFYVARCGGTWGTRQRYKDWVDMLIYLQKKKKRERKAEKKKMINNDTISINHIQNLSDKRFSISFDCLLIERSNSTTQSMGIKDNKLDEILLLAFFWFAFASLHCISVNQKCEACRYLSTAW